MNRSTEAEFEPQDESIEPQTSLAGESSAERPIHDAEPNHAADLALTDLTRGLKQLQQDIVVQLAQDVTRLQTEKHRLMIELDRLRQERSLATTAATTPKEIGSLSLEDQQAWIAQLARVLAAHLEEKIAQRLESSDRQSASDSLRSADPLAIDDSSQASAESSLETSPEFSQPQANQDLIQNSYRQPVGQSSVIGERQQQGETTLDVLVSRMDDQRRDTIVTAPMTSNVPSRNATHSPNRAGETGDRTELIAAPYHHESIDHHPASAETPPPAPNSQHLNRLVATFGFSPVQIGLGLAMAYTLVLSIFYLSLKVMFSARSILPWFAGGLESGGILSPSLGNVVLVLLLRMIVVMALMPVLASRLCPQWWGQMRDLIRSCDRPLQYQIFGSGVGLFCSQILIYLALGQLPTAIAIAMFFVFPIATVLGAWLLFQAKPTRSRLGLLLVILIGVALSPARSSSVDVGNLVTGGLYAISSGFAFSGYVLLTQQCGKRLHPITFSMANFAVVLGLAIVGYLLSVILGGWFGLLPVGWLPSVPATELGGLFVACLWLGLLTLVSYLLNNFAVRCAGASLASIVGATAPVMTGLLAAIAISEWLPVRSVLGIFLVTIGVACLSLERLYCKDHHS
jgi:drug/metabolite transporter (DMT)-like permease